jgi:hypothetical protein
MYLMLSLARLFEGQPKRLKGKIDTRRHPRNSEKASIPLLVHWLRRKDCRRAVQVSARAKGELFGSHEGEQSEQSASQHLAKGLNVYASMRATHQGRWAMVKLQRYRNEALAHTLIVDEKNVPSPMYKEMCRLLDVATEFVEEITAAVEDRHLYLELSIAEREKEAIEFWELALQAVVKHPVTEE